MQRQLDDSKKGLQSEIDGNHFTNTNRINDIAEKLANILKDASKDKDDLLLRHSIYIRTVSFYLLAVALISMSTRMSTMKPKLF